MVKRTIFAGGATGQRGGGVNLLLSDYKKFTAVAKTEARRIFEQAAKMVLDEAIPLTPQDTGALRQSGRVVTQESPRGVNARVVFGGPDFQVNVTRNAPSGVVDYALFVHEDTTGTRNYKVGGPKFLELGATKAAPKVDAFIKQELRKLVNKA